MNAMAPTRPAELLCRRARLTTGPAAAAEARNKVRAIICAWDVPVDPDVAVLLTSELVTNAIRHEAGGTVTLAISCPGGQLRIEVHDTSCFLPVLADASTDEETGRGLMLVDTLSAEWGCYSTPTGKAVYFTLAFQPEAVDQPRRDSWAGTVSREPTAIDRPRRTRPGSPRRSPRHDGAQG